MLFVGLGVVLLLLKLLGIAPVAGLAWWWVLAPFACAVAWWGWADSSGYTKRREMDRMDERKAARRSRQMESLGQEDPKKKRR